MFAITDASQKIVNLGLALTPVEDKTQKILLYYSEPGTTDTQQVVSFKVPDMTQQWNRFTLTVEREEVRLYMDCEEYHSATLRRSQKPLSFESGSGIFVANAGGTGLERFVVGHYFTFLQKSETFFKNISLCLYWFTHLTKNNYGNCCNSCKYFIIACRYSQC